MTHLQSLTPDQLSKLCTELDWPAYVARQLFGWIWRRGITRFADMTDLSRERRALLSARFRLAWPTVTGAWRSSDGTTRLRLELGDGAAIESVFIPEDDRRTVCVSTQVGCRLACRFCRTGQLGFIRDLSWDEIAGQVMVVSRTVATRPTNVVFMGMGEPLLNLGATLTAASVLNSSRGPAIGARRMTISTAGIPKRIRELARFRIQIRLAVSLNAADDDTRSRLMPVNRVHPLAELMSAVREYAAVTRRRVTLEYVLVAGVNDRQLDAERLAELLRGLPCKVNLIPCNSIPEGNSETPIERDVERFADWLRPRLPAVTVRRSRGSEIMAACGQLAGVDSDRRT